MTISKSNGSRGSAGKPSPLRLDKDASIAIVGCGIAGLSTAIALAKAGYSSVSIFEKDACRHTRREGFGLTLTYNPKGALAQLGILEQVAQQDCPSRAHYVFSPDGTVLGYYGNAFSPSRGYGQRGNIRIPRQVLQKIMTDRLAAILQESQETMSPSRIYWGHTLAGIRELKHEGKVELQFTHKTKGSTDTSTSTTTTTTIDTKDGTEAMQGSETKAMEFDLVIAADGVRSSVVQTLAPNCQPRPLNVMIILGIAENFNHPLLTERGFYVVDGKHRLFTMPYQGDKYASNRRTMWQLSYRYEDEDSKAILDQHRNPEFLRETVLEICSQWHEAVPSMIRSTPLETIWGTPLLDRSPKSIQQSFQSTSRILCIGDALHAMSPFKGQGANNALLDGPLIVEWLQRAKVEAAVRGIWREAVQRTNKIVQASREAAEYWHSPLCIPEPGQQQSQCHFAGVQGASASRLLQTLSQRNITANLSGELDSSIRDVIQELGIGLAPAEGTDETHDEDVHLQVIKFASIGAVSELRKLSLKHASAVQLARDVKGQSALHVAAQWGHYQASRWLLTEAFVDPWAVDSRGRSPLDDASDPEIISLLTQVMSVNSTTTASASITVPRESG